MQLRDIMTRDFESIRTEDPVRKAAQMMRDLDVGILPVHNEDSVVGTVTDRDITIRATAEGEDADSTSVSRIMSEGVLFGYEDDDIAAAARTMEEKQVRRLFVLNGSDKCVGVVSLGDLASGSEQALSGEVLEELSKSAH